jgi:hypothetical protein
VGSAGAVSAGGAGVSLGTRRAWIGSWQPSWPQVPSQVTRPGVDLVSVTCPAVHVPRTRTDAFGLLVTPVTPFHLSEQCRTLSPGSIHGRNVIGVTISGEGIVSGVTEVRTDLGPRLVEAAARTRDANGAARASQELRDQLVEQAIDEGMSYGAVARLTGLSRPRVIAILAASQKENA